MSWRPPPAPPHNVSLCHGAKHHSNLSFGCSVMGMFRMLYLNGARKKKRTRICVMLTTYWSLSTALCLISFIKTTHVTHINPILEQCDLTMIKIAYKHTSRSTARCLIVVRRVTHIYYAVLTKAESIYQKELIFNLMICSSRFERQKGFLLHF